MTMPTARIFEGARGAGRYAGESVGASSWDTLLESQFPRKSAVNNARNEKSLTLLHLRYFYEPPAIMSPRGRAGVPASLASMARRGQSGTNPTDSRHDVDASAHPEVAMVLRVTTALSPIPSR